MTNLVLLIDVALTSLFSTMEWKNGPARLKREPSLFYTWVSLPLPRVEDDFIKNERV